MQGCPGPRSTPRAAHKRAAGVSGAQHAAPRTAPAQWRMLVWCRLTFSRVLGSCSPPLGVVCGCTTATVVCALASTYLVTCAHQCRNSSFRVQGPALRRLWPARTWPPARVRRSLTSTCPPWQVLTEQTLTITCTFKNHHAHLRITKQAAPCNPAGFSSKLAGRACLLGVIRQRGARAQSEPSSAHGTRPANGRGCISE